MNAEVVLPLFGTTAMMPQISGLLLAAKPDSAVSSYIVLFIVVGLFAVLWALARLTDNAATIRKTKLGELKAREGNLQKDKTLVDEERRQLEQEKDITRRQLAEEKEGARRRIGEDREALSILADQKCQGFPWLADAYSEYSYLQQLREANVVSRKKHRAVKSAQRIREIAGDRRVIEKKLRVLQGIVNYWTDIFPFLEDWLGEDVDEELLQRLLSRNIEAPVEAGIPDIEEDPVRVILNRLSDAEYQRLSTTERNQRALDAWCARWKSRWQIGRDYERYIGYLYEQKGYFVYYQGAVEGYADLGRDLIAQKGTGTVVVQCKYWAQHKTIHEKHINQLFGTKVVYEIEHPREAVHAKLCTSTTLSDMAQKFARHLNVEVEENLSLQAYPVIKCNVARGTGEKIYHLPFDQMYDRTVVEPRRGECYVETVAEAERLGFRRAWRWHGPDSDEAAHT